MKPEVAALLRSVVKLADEDLVELRDAVAQIDHKAGEAWHAYRVRDEALSRFGERIGEIEDRLQALERQAA